MNTEFKNRTETLKTEIAKVFPPGDPPLDEELVLPESLNVDGEPEAIREVLSGAKWDEVRIRLINIHLGHYFVYLTLRARLYYLPLWMTASLDDFDRGERLVEMGDTTTYTLSALTPPPAGPYWEDIRAFADYYRALTSAQADVVSRFLAFIFETREADLVNEDWMPALKEFWINGMYRSFGIGG